MTRIAIASCAELLPEGDPDDQVLARACDAIGMQARVHSWSDPDVDWDSFDLTVIRSTWDYASRRSEFLDWVNDTPRLHNPAAVVASNSDKRYLKVLADAGIPIVPTTFFDPGELVALPSAGEIVLKPSVGAGSKGAGRFDLSKPAGRASASEHAIELQTAGRTVMAQPYLDAVDTDGETALIFIDSTFSHAILKRAMLPPHSRQSLAADELFVAEHIESREPSSAQRELATAVIDFYGGSLLYARVDLLPTPDGPVVIEVELTEPSLFLAHSGDAPARLARAIAGRAR